VFGCASPCGKTKRKPKPYVVVTVKLKETAWVPEWMAQRAVLRDYRALEIRRRRANRLVWENEAMVEVEPDRPEKAVLDAQEQHWQTTFAHKLEMFGSYPSGPAVWAAERFKEEGKQRLLELGCGQGRDTLFFRGERSSRHCYGLLAVGSRRGYGQSAVSGVECASRHTAA